MQSPSISRSLSYSLLIAFVSLTVSCSKDHDLISSYVVMDTTVSALKQKSSSQVLSDAEKQKEAKKTTKSLQVTSK